MTAPLLEQLQGIHSRHQDIAGRLASPEALRNPSELASLSRELSVLEPLAALYQEHCRLDEDEQGARALLDDADSELRDLAAEELRGIASVRIDLMERLHQQLLKRADTEEGVDAAEVFLEVRAGTGGEEAALFASDLFRMYARYAQHCGWQLELLSQRSGEYGGAKELISRLAGSGVYAALRFESGVHRVQRVPSTESQGRVHTSACTVAVLPAAVEVGAVVIDKAELRVDTFRASGAGGQHVNKTDSAVRVTHLPTGVVVECQAQRSQTQNRLRAMELLRARLLAQAKTEQSRAQAEQRRDMVGSGDRSERIRTYNFPQGRVTDHRIGLTLYQLPDVLDGALDPLVTALVRDHRASRLATLGLGSSSNGD